MSIFGNNSNYNGAPNCAPGVPRVEGGGNFIWNNEQGSSELQAFVSTTIIQGDVTQVNRIVKYQLFWNFYEGQHWRQYNDTFLHFNYCKVIVNKVNEFLMGDTAFSVSVQNDDGEEVPEDLESTAEAYLESIWKKNDKLGTATAMLQMGGVCGDAWVSVQWDDKEKKIRITVLDSRQCFPEFYNGDINQLIGFTVRQPLQKNDKEYKLKCTRYTDTSVEIWYQKTTAIGDQIAKFEPSTVDNTYGFIPVVHMQNVKNASSYFGFSDLHDILTLNKTYNEETQTMKEIVDYYISPVTVITGGTLKVATRGVGNVWSGLPAEANVFNLTLGEDMQGMESFLKRIKDGIHEISDVPESVLGKVQNVSNTSAAALQIMYQPLIQRAKAKAVTYTDGVRQINKMILRIGKKYDTGKKLMKKLIDIDANVADNYDFIPVWKYGLPADVMQELQQGQMEISLGVTSRKQLMTKLGKRNVPKLIKEIDDERLQDGVLQGRIQQLVTPQQEQPDNGDNKTKTKQPVNK